MAAVVIAVLLAIAMPQFTSYQENQKVNIAVNDLRMLDNRLQSFKLSSERYPDSLTELPQPAPLDPWGRPYQYSKIEDNTEAKGHERKDKNLVPINSDFDLYSMGADGKTSPPLTAKNSRDDVVRANNGTYYGLGSKY